MTDNPWPSSDWMAYLSERGLVATLLLLLAFLSIGLRALRELPAARVAGDVERATAALTLIGTLVATVVVGMFDAVLLIAIPTMFVWLLAGVLSPPSPPRRSMSVGPLVRPVLLLFGLAAVVRSAGQIQAMALYHGASRLSTVETAAMYDPGSYRIRMRLADGYIARGECGKAVPHASAANRMFPNAADPKSALRRCGVRPTTK